MDTDKPCFLSVIICTYNRCDLLRLCLDTFVKQKDISEDDWELLLVDNNCTDGTKDVAVEYSGIIKNMKYVLEPAIGLSNARNRGADESRGTYLAYVDDDVLVADEYVSKVIATLRKESPDIMGGPIYPFYTDPKPKWFKDEFKIRKFADISGYSFTCRVSGGNFIINKIVFGQNGRFNPEYGMRGKELGIGEERMLLEAYRKNTTKLHQKVFYSMECSLRHHVPKYKMTYRYFFGRHFVSGKTMAKMQAKPSKTVLLFKTFIRCLELPIYMVVKLLISRFDYLTVARGLTFKFGVIVGTIKLLVW